jgi:hypothetical protein
MTCKVSSASGGGFGRPKWLACPVVGSGWTTCPTRTAWLQTIRAYRGDLTQFAAHHGGEIGELIAAPVHAVPPDGRPGALFAVAVPGAPVSV